MTNKKKLKLLGIATPLVLLLCYRVGISKTIDQYKAYKENTASELEYKASMRASKELEAKQQTLDGFFSAYKLDTLSASRNLLTIVTNFCNEHQLQLREYKPIKTSTEGTVHVLTRSVTVEGAFTECVQLVYALERKYQAGRVSAVSYTGYTDQQSRQQRLSCTLFIQNIINRT